MDAHYNTLTIVGMYKMNNFIIKPINGHYEVYDKNNYFVCSADNYCEAIEEINKMTLAL
jgi:hypothetical protein